MLTSLVVDDDNTNADLLAVTVLLIADLVDIAAAVIITKIIVCISDECCDVRDLNSITLLYSYSYCGCGLSCNEMIYL